LTSLETLLDQEVQALEGVLATLRDERAALDQRSPDALIAASNAKAEAVARAARLEQQRREYLEAHPARPAPAEGRLLTELKKLAGECRRQNDANGLLIRGQRRRVEGSLNVLRGGGGKSEVYGRDGETRPVRPSRTPLASY